MSLEESNKMSQKIPSQDSPSEPEWKLEDLQKAIIDSAEMYDELLDKAGQHELPAQTAEACGRWKDTCGHRGSRRKGLTNHLSNAIVSI